MTTIDYLEKQYRHAFTMVKFGEVKNMTLIAINVIIILGMLRLAGDATSKLLYYFLIYVAVMCCIAAIIGITALIAKIKFKTDNTALSQNDNLLFFATIAHLTADELIRQIEAQYECERSNANHEKDLAKQIIITSQIAARKFKLFNVGIAFTFAGVLTPLSLIVYKVFLDTDK